MQVTLYDQFKKTKEAGFRKDFIWPLLNRLGFYGIETKHGPQEFGKDFVFSENHRLAGPRFYAIVAKHIKLVRQQDVSEILRQVGESFKKPFLPLNSPRECHVCAVYVFNSGEFSPNAIEILHASLKRENYGDNVHFFGSERLQGININSAYISEGNARARLVGLLGQINLNFKVLDAICKTSRIENDRGISFDSRSLMFHAIQSCLGEPIGGLDNQFLRILETYWYDGSVLENIKFALQMSQITAAQAKSGIDRLIRIATRLRDECTPQILSSLIGILQHVHNIPFVGAQLSDERPAGTVFDIRVVENPTFPMTS